MRLAGGQKIAFRLLLASEDPENSKRKKIEAASFADNSPIRMPNSLCSFHKSLQQSPAILSCKWQCCHTCGRHMHVFEILRTSCSCFPQETSSTSSCKTIFNVLYADESLPHFFSQICAANFLLFPARQPHNAYMTAAQCLYHVLLQQNSMQYARRSMCGQNRVRFRVKKP